MVDPWTFQLEVRDPHAAASSSPRANTQEDHTIDSTPPSSPLNRVTSLQLRAGGMNYFCLQAKTPGEQNEWRGIIENYVAELAKHRSIKNLERRALDHRRSVTHNAVDVELERVMHATMLEEQV